MYSVTAVGDIMRYFYTDGGEKDRAWQTTQSGKPGAIIYINITSVGSSGQLIMI